MSKVFLFDLDGTLCKSRKKIKEDMINILCRANKGVEIGILTGSDLDFLKEQCEELFVKLSYSNKVYAMACNGTKSFEVTKKNDHPEYKLIKEESIETFLGAEDFSDLMKELIFMQADLVTKYLIPLTGNFITCRGSTINWCPIGRGANDKQREFFIKSDKDLGIRAEQIRLLKEFIKEADINLVANIAGDTSFDLYPEGWDKTYAMQFFPNREVFFWGDRMHPDGNDYTMHLLLKDASFAIKDPEDTANSVKKLLDSLSL